MPMERSHVCHVTGGLSLISRVVRPIFFRRPIWLQKRISFSAHTVRQVRKNLVPKSTAYVFPQIRSYLSNVLIVNPYLPQMSGGVGIPSRIVRPIFFRRPSVLTQKALFHSSVIGACQGKESGQNHQHSQESQFPPKPQKPEYLPLPEGIKVLWHGSNAGSLIVRSRRLIEHSPGEASPDHPTGVYTSPSLDYAADYADGVHGDRFDMGLTCRLIFGFRRFPPTIPCPEADNYVSNCSIDLSPENISFVVVSTRKIGEKSTEDSLEFCQKYVAEWYKRNPSEERIGLLSYSSHRITWHGLFSSRGFERCVDEKLLGLLEDRMMRITMAMPMPIVTDSHIGCFA